MPVILSAAKNPHEANERFFAALRMTGLVVLDLIRLRRRVWILRCAQNDRRGCAGLDTFIRMGTEMPSLPYNEMMSEAYIVYIVRATLAVALETM